MPIAIPVPKLQIAFAALLEELRGQYLLEALRDTVKTVDIAALDRELAECVPGNGLSELAGRGLRGELVYAAPCLLRANPRLLGYYRLLLGFSQKEFFTAAFGVAAFGTMEKKGSLTPKAQEALPELCRALNASAAALVEGVGVERLSRELLDDLTLLTLGPQLRGGANVRRGLEGIQDVFLAIYEIVRHAASSSTSEKIELQNAAGKVVTIQFAPDPDIVITMEMGGGGTRNVIAIEVKGGTDFSNIHNRLGEAEKSHQKAKANGYVECWTVVNVDRFDLKMARRESPTTNRFYLLSALKGAAGKEYTDFKERIISLTGIMENNSGSTRE